MGLESHTLADVADLVSRVTGLEDRLRELESRTVPAIVPLTKFPAWYRHATNSPPWLRDDDGEEIQKPISEAMLRNWSKRPWHYKVDWVVRRGRAVYVDSEKFVKWFRKPHPGVRVRKGIS